MSTIKNFCDLCSNLHCHTCPRLARMSKTDEFWIRYTENNSRHHEFLTKIHVYTWVYPYLCNALILGPYGNFQSLSYDQFHPVLQFFLLLFFFLTANDTWVCCMAALPFASSLFLYCTPHFLHVFFILPFISSNAWTTHAVHAFAMCSLFLLYINE